MKILKYKKLVRDKIPEIIKADGGECSFHVATKDEFPAMVTQKLLEEVEELIENPCADEVADVLEVIEVFARIHNIGLGYIKEAKTKKRDERGGFQQMIILDDATKK